MRYFVLLSAVMVLLLGGCRGSKPDQISAQMAYEGVSNYCHREFDWSPALNIENEAGTINLRDYLK